MLSKQLTTQVRQVKEQYNGKKYISLNIIELQQNRTKVEEIRGGNQDIGIEVDVDIKDNWEFFYT